jgi:DNA-binding response OmpR family regulator
MELGRVTVLTDSSNGLSETLLGDLTKDGFVSRVISPKSLPDPSVSRDGCQFLIAFLSSPAEEEVQWLESLLRSDDAPPVVLICRVEELARTRRVLESPLVTWLTYPPTSEELRERIRWASQHSLLRETLVRARQRLEDWRRDLDELAHAAHAVAQHSGGIPLTLFLDHTVRNMAQTLLDVSRVITSTGWLDAEAVACHLFDCPRRAALMRSLQDTVQTLERTKSSFKSQELGELRRRIETTLRRDADGA